MLLLCSSSIVGASATFFMGKRIIGVVAGALGIIGAGRVTGSREEYY